MLAFVKALSQRPAVAATPTPPPAPVPPSLLDNNNIDETYLTPPLYQNSLFKALLRKLDGYISEEHLTAAFNDYHVGTQPTVPYSPVFLQIDSCGQIRTGKIMGYDTDAHRNGKIQWLHKQAGGSGTYELRQCLFGSHLTMTLPDLTTALMPSGRNRWITHDDVRLKAGVIWLFESEKTALMVRALAHKMGETWILPMATGGCGGLNPTPERLADPWSNLQILRGRSVVLFPDNGKYDEWSAHAEALRTICRGVRVTDIMENVYKQYTVTPDNTYWLRRGDDLGDLLMVHPDPQSLITEIYTPAPVMDPPDPTVPEDVATILAQALAKHRATAACGVSAVP